MKIANCLLQSLNLDILKGNVDCGDYGSEGVGEERGGGDWGWGSDGVGTKG